MTTTTAATCSFTLDDDVLRYAQKRSANLVPRGTQAAVGLAGGLVGGLILAQSVKSDFFHRLLTPAGTYGLSVSDVGLQLTGFGDQQLILRWEDIETWAVDKEVFMAQDVRGRYLVLPRRAVPEQIFSIIEEICTIAAKRANRKLGRGSYGKWSQLGTGEKIVRGFIYTVGGIIVLLSLMVFAIVAFGP